MGSGRYAGFFRRRLFGAAFVFCFFTLFCRPVSSGAEDVCARVKIEIVQELTFERVAFDARMKITNGLALPLNNIRVDISIEDAGGSDVSSLFFVKLAGMDQIQAVDGTGTVQANSYGEIHWLIIPSPGAGGEAPEGVVYYVGATLGYTAGGNTETMEVEPDQITVKPQPLLVLDYFLPRHVYGDDPYTPETEPPIPYDLGVRVQNIGYGTAKNLKIDSGQPKIVDNAQGLLVDFRIIGSEVGGRTATPSLKVDFGDIESQTCGTARWQMISTLTGRFVEFDASFTHADELGGELTSLIDRVNANRLLHNVLVDRAGRDDLLDFLGVPETDADAVQVWESDNHTGVVQDVSDQSTLTSQAGGTYSLLTPTGHDFIYVKKTAPTGGKIPIRSVYRSDGKAVKSANFWIQKERESGSQDAVYFCLFDTDTTGRYTVAYDFDAVQDTTPPVSRVVIQEPSVGQDPTFVNEATEMLFLSEDPESGVKNMRFAIGNGEFEPVINPFSFSKRPALAEGPHTLRFYAVNQLNLEETPKTVDLYLDQSAPTDLELSATPGAITPGAPVDAPVDRATLVAFSFHDAVSVATATVAVATGAGGLFDELPKVRTYTRTVAPGLGHTLSWDGTDAAGQAVAPGTYSIRLTANDGLGHVTVSAPVTVEVLAYLDEESLSPSGGDQMFPDVYEETVVWQDDRDGNWEIYKKEGDQTVNLTNESHSQEHPAISSQFVVWQDNRSGDWDIHYYRRSDGVVAGLVLEGDQKSPDVDGSWVVFQDDRAGNWEIYACDLSAATPVPVRISDGHERDQVKPRISGTRVVWEDYRHGNPDVYLYGPLHAGTLTRITVQEGSYQTDPVIDGDVILWVDTRNGQNDIYAYYLTPGSEGERRLTYQTTDQVQPAVQGDHLAYVDFQAPDNPDLSWGRASAGISDPVVNDPARQERPALFGKLIVWQDDRLGRWQIYQSSVNRPDLIMTLAPGMNLLAAPGAVVAEPQTDTAFDLLTVWNGSGHAVRRILQYDPGQGVYVEAVWNPEVNPASPEGTDFALQAQRALVVYADAGSRVQVDVLKPETAQALPVGLNAVGWANLPAGYRASHLMLSLGLSNVRSLRSFDSATGSFLSLSVEAVPSEEGTTYVLRGRDFPLTKGMGCLVYMTRPLAAWRP